MKCSQNRYTDFQSALDQPLEHVRCQLETRNQKHFTSKFAFFFLYKLANINVNISVQETNSAILFITFSYKSQLAHKKKSLLNQKKILKMFNFIYRKLQNPLFTSTILKSCWEGYCWYSVPSFNCILISFYLVLISGIRKGRCTGDQHWLHFQSTSHY